MQLQTSTQSILVNILRKGVLRLSACICEATASTAAAVVSHLERLWRISSLVMFESVSPSSKGKRIAIIL